MNFEQYKSANKDLWEEWTPINFKSIFYDVESFLKGKNSLLPLEINEMGDVKNKSLLHLQCHFGMDTLSWARMGAEVTGIDFSEKAVETAKTLSQKTGINAEFIQADIYKIPQLIKKQHDIVFTSYGVLCWLPDIKKWAEIISYCLKPKGVFYMAELHPFINMFECASNSNNLTVSNSYFYSEEPSKWDAEYSYADDKQKTKNSKISFEWVHTLSDIITSLISAGLEIEFLHEHPFCAYGHFSTMKKDESGWWKLPPDVPKIPLLFSLKAKKKVGD